MTSVALVGLSLSSFFNHWAEQTFHRVHSQASSGAELSCLEEWEACLCVDLLAEFGSFNLLSAVGD